MPERSSLNLGEIGKLIATAKQFAKRYRALTGRLIGITGQAGRLTTVYLEEHIGIRAPEEKG